MFRLIVPTRDSEGWIGVLLNAYRREGIEPLFVFDMRSRDDTRKRLAEMNAQVVEMRPDKDFAEGGMIEFGSRAAGTRWVLRLDDDEFPSCALLRWLREHGVRSVRTAWALSRRELFLNGDEILYSRSPTRFWDERHPGFLNPQVRFYRADLVRYEEKLHSCGFDAKDDVGMAPDGAFFLHMSCLMRSPQERYEKLVRYEAISANSAWKLADEYLPELTELTGCEADTDGLVEFSELLAAWPRSRDKDFEFLDGDELKRLLAIRQSYIDELQNRQGKFAKGMAARPLAATLYRFDRWLRDSIRVPWR